jgi:hypothetical protein
MSHIPLPGQGQPSPLRSYPERVRAPYVDPQAPLGGPDGKKDLVAWRDGKKYIAACYFPTALVDFAGITRKYKSDYPGLSPTGPTGSCSS